MHEALTAPRRPPAERVVALAVSALLLAAACGDGGEAEIARLVAQGREKLAARDASSALSLARSALAAHGPDARLQLVAATACLQLERSNDALGYADGGLESAGPAAEAGLRADLHWARGTALMRRFRELGVEQDWLGANLSLEQATPAGTHRAEAAFLLVALQDLGGHENLERQEKFARLVVELAPDGELATHVRELMAGKGRTL